MTKEESIPVGCAPPTAHHMYYRSHQISGGQARVGMSMVRSNLSWVIMFTWDLSLKAE